MSVAGIAAAGGSAPITGLLATVPRPGATGTGTSSFGPAYLLSGTKDNLTAGLYDSLGKLIAPDTGKVAAASSSKAQEKRKETLLAIAGRIDGGDIAGGRAEAQRLLKKQGDDIGALRLVAHTYLADKNYKEAERYYGRAAALAPDHARLRGELTNARTLQQSDEKVLADARRAIKDPTRRNDGLRLLGRLTDRSPDNVEAYLALADGYRATRKPVQALIALHEAVTRSDKEQADEVIAQVRPLVQAHGEVGLPHNILGRALVKAGRVNEGIKELDTAVKLTPENTGYATDLANVYVTRAKEELVGGNVVAARLELRAAKDLDPFNESLAEAEGEAALFDARRDVKLEGYTRALINLSAAARKGPESDSFKQSVAGLFLSVGAHFRDKGADTTALIAFQKAHELDPTSAAARNNTATLSNKVGMEAYNSNSYDASVTYLDQAYQIDRTNTTYRQNLAGAYNKRGVYHQNTNKLANAINDFKAAYRLDPTNTTIEANLTVALS